MRDIGIDISHHTSDPVDMYLGEDWDYVVTVCDGARENCPVFPGRVKHRMHMGFEDPSLVTGPDAFIHDAFIRVRDEISDAFHRFYHEQLKPGLEIIQEAD